MKSKREYEEKQRHGTVNLPVGLHRLEYPKGRDVIFYLHWHSEFELLVVTEGQIRFTIEEREYLLKEGDCVFVNANLLHSARTADGNACSFFAVVFSYEALEDDIHSSFAKQYIRPVLNGKYLLEEFLSSDAKKGQAAEPLPAPQSAIDTFTARILQTEQRTWQQEIVFYLSQICRCPADDLEKHMLLVRSRLLLIWSMLYCHGRQSPKAAPEQSASFERLAPVVRYMKAHYASDLTISELSSMIPMSEGQFCRVFKQHMKLSPIQYLRRYRILQSCHLLRETDKKIGEIASLTGFNNISYFNKVFLEVIGCTPKEYRGSVHS